MARKKNSRANVNSRQSRNNSNFYGTSPNSPTEQVPNIQDILLKEYELCFTRSCSVYDLTNEIIKLYTTIYFAVMSVFGFAFQSISETLFRNRKLLPICLLLCLIIYGYVTMFMHIATWSARNNYRKRRSYLLQHLLGVSNQDCLKKSIIDYLCIPRYVDSGVLHSLSLYLWYFLYILLCNWIAIILLAAILVGLWSKPFWGIVIVFLPFEWVSAEVHTFLKKISHKKKSKKKREKFSSTATFDFYKIPWEV